jgi:hypothetical protein
MKAETLDDYSTKMFALEARHNRQYKKRLEIVSRLKSRRFIKALKNLLTDAGGYALAFVKEPRGTKQECDFRPIKWEWVDQTTGWSGDDFSGYIYIQIKETRYLRISYAC